jgi:hypothetical protein
VDDYAFLDTLRSVLKVCDDTGAPIEEQLTVLELAWIAWAQRARSAALALPGGFPAEQARQLDRLVKIVRLVKDDVPDLELERLHQEGDIEGVVDYLKKLRDGDTSGV